MRNIAKKIVVICTILTMLSVPVFADRNVEVRNTNPQLNQQDKKDNSQMRTKSLLNIGEIEEKSEIEITNEEDKTVIKGKFKQKNTTFLLTVRSLDDKSADNDSIKYINTGKTDENGEYTFRLELSEGVYLVEVTCNSERVIKDYKVSLR